VDNVHVHSPGSTPIYASICLNTTCATQATLAFVTCSSLASLLHERKIRTIAPDLSGCLTVVTPAQHPPSGLQPSGHPARYAKHYGGQEWQSFKSIFVPEERHAFAQFAYQNADRMEGGLVRT
jgi:hypothetical protein